MANKNRKHEPVARRSGGRPHSQDQGSDPADSTASPRGADQCETRVEPGSRQKTIPGRNGGTLTPFQPGVTGNPHRGPSRFPGRNIVRGILVSALSANGQSLEDLRRKRPHRKGATLIPTAMAEHCKQGYKNIAKDAALGKPEAYGPFLRMMDHAHTILQPERDELGQESVPRPPTFVRSSEPVEPPAEEPPAPAPTGLVNANGQEYAAG